MPDIPQGRLKGLSGDLTQVVGQYVLTKADKAALAKAARILWGLSEDGSLQEKVSPTRTPLIRDDYEVTEEDARLIHEARLVLASDMRTHAISYCLTRLHQYPNYLDIRGWKWHKAAIVLTRDEQVSLAQCDNFDYYAGIARSLKDSDETAPLRGKLQRLPTEEDLQGLWEE